MIAQTQPLQKAAKGMQAFGQHGHRIIRGDSTLENHSWMQSAAFSEAASSIEWISTGFRVASIAKIPPFQSDIEIYQAIEISWLSVSGQTYQVQYSTNLIYSNWFNLGPTVIGYGSTNSVFDSTRKNAQRHYRIKAE